MTNKKKNTLLSAVVILATIGVFLLLNHKVLDTGMCWFTFGVIVVSELFLSYAWISFNSLPQRMAVVIISAIQTILNMLVSALFLNVFPKAYIGFAVYAIISFVLLIIFAFFFYKAAGSAEKQVNAKDYFKRCRLAVNMMAANPEAAEYRNELVKLEENLRFCNDGVFVNGDADIYAAICDLKPLIAEGSDQVLTGIQRVNALIQQHDFISKTTSRKDQIDVQGSESKNK